MIDILEEIQKQNKVENQDNVDINFNFQQVKEVKTGTVSGLSNNLKDNVKVILFCVNNQSFKRTDKTYNQIICGKSMKDWVLSAVEGYNTKLVDMDSQDDYFYLTKQNLDLQFKYTLVLFTDTPLLTSKTVTDITEYFAIKNLSVLKFSRGYMFETDYLSRIEKIYNPQIQYFEEEDFITAYNLKQFALITDIMRNRILSYHQKQGVLIIDANSTQIDADVSIENDVTIYANNKILGKTIIEAGTVLSYNNIVENSVVMQNSFIENSTIKNSIVGKDCNIQNYCVLQNKTILGDQTVLKGYNILDNKKTARATILNPSESR